MGKGTVLIVDDIEMNRELLAEILEDDYNALMAADGYEALRILEENYSRISAMLLDMVMPGLDGVGVLEAAQDKPYLRDIPVLVITGETDIALERRCFDLGVTDFIHKPFDNLLVKRRTHNAAELYQYKKSLEERGHEQTLDLEAKNLELERVNENIISVLGMAVEARNMESGEHIVRVKQYTKLLADKMMVLHPEYGLTPDEIVKIVSTSPLHDIGKIKIADGILLKPGKLTPEEFDEMKRHTIKGEELIINVGDIWDEAYTITSREISRWHHERYDGRGYPDGLKGDEIPISAQLVSLADVYDALVNDRCYKKAFPKDVAFDMIMTGKCGVFSPKLLECFVECRPEMENLADQTKISIPIAKR